MLSADEKGEEWSGENCDHWGGLLGCRRMAYSPKTPQSLSLNLLASHERSECSALDLSSAVTTSPCLSVDRATIELRTVLVQHPGLLRFDDRTLTEQAGVLDIEVAPRAHVHA